MAMANSKNTIKMSWPKSSSKIDERIHSFTHTCIPDADDGGVKDGGIYSFLSRLDTWPQKKRPELSHVVLGAELPTLNRTLRSFE